MTYTYRGPLNVASRLPPVPIVDSNGMRWCGQCRRHSLGTVYEPETACPCCCAKRKGERDD